MGVDSDADALSCVGRLNMALKDWDAVRSDCAGAVTPQSLHLSKSNNNACLVRRPFANSRNLQNHHGEFGSDLIWIWAARGD
jgi:hypothetical protein